MASSDAVTAAAGPVMEAQLRPRDPPLEARQTTVNELRHPNADALVLGFRRHRMNQQLTVLSSAPLTARQVTMVSDCPVWGRGTPLPPCPFISSSFALFTFSFLSLALPIFFFGPFLPFLPE